MANVEVDGEFLVLVASLLELKARGGTERRCRSRTWVPTTLHPGSPSAWRAVQLPGVRALSRRSFRHRVRPLLPPRPCTSRAGAGAATRGPETGVARRGAACARRRAARAVAPPHSTNLVPASLELPRALPRGASPARPASSSTRRSTRSAGSSRPSRFSRGSSCARQGRSPSGKLPPFEEITVWNNAA